MKSKFLALKTTDCDAVLISPCDEPIALVRKTRHLFACAQCELALR